MFVRKTDLGALAFSQTFVIFLICASDFLLWRFGYLVSWLFLTSFGPILLDENLERLSGLLVSSLLVEEAMMMMMVRTMKMYIFLPLHLDGGGQLYGFQINLPVFNVSLNVIR